MSKSKLSPLAKLIRCQAKEIEKYKWIESEKVGYDIGLERATREWLDKHFNEWKKHKWKQVISEALTK